MTSQLTLCVELCSLGTCFHPLLWATQKLVYSIQQFYLHLIYFDDFESINLSLVEKSIWIWMNLLLRSFFSPFTFQYIFTSFWRYNFPNPTDTSILKSNGMKRVDLLRRWMFHSVKRAWARSRMVRSEDLNVCNQSHCWMNPGIKIPCLCSLWWTQSCNFILTLFKERFVRCLVGGDH